MYVKRIVINFKWINKKNHFPTAYFVEQINDLFGNISRTQTAH